MKLLSKNNLGIFSIFILVILLSQSRIFDVLTNHHLGRLLLLSLIIMIAYINKYLGLLSVLFVIIAFDFNQTNHIYSYNYYENFDTNTQLDGSNNITDAKKQQLSSDLSNTENNMKTTQTSIQKLQKDLANLKQEVQIAAENANNGKAREGFCMAEKETNILRGKQSNSIKVFSKNREQTDDVMPMDSSVFSDDFYKF